ncbi:MAG: RNA polymerase sporulation sigma factor SigK [Oscillospiraceae bacterium]|nr:RNA polymerase sporulation sigma factor SigK [Oscillospiraceae bacterium]MBQ9981541.1 RNA polymerase sporulation sigma factor SigK [Oscillospiraceae bacterium]
MFTEIIAEALKNLVFFALHVDNTGVFPKPLSKEEEEKYFRLMNEENDKEARNKLIEHNLRLVAHIIKKYYSKSGDQEELISIGTIGLIKAVSTFKSEKGSRFATYASRCIENEILMNFRALKKTAGDIYMDTPIDTDKDGNQLTLVDIIADDTSVTDEVELIINSRKLYSDIEKCLDKRELEIITFRYGLFGYEPLTQKQVSDKLGISRSYVSRIEKKALSKLKKRMM